jgi:DNA (cytosine-5)-methyltransferase 1
MKFATVCSGIEAASVAWNQLGWRARFFAENARFPSSVLAHHYPDVANLGDLNAFADWPDDSIDVLAGGTPCQSFSLAGLREGLTDPRGNLTLVYLACAARFRPRWLVWENVTGVLSNDGGRAFGTLLAGLARLGYGWAYRILDAQHFGLAQRRNRVWVVGCLGKWAGAAAVLFEPQSLRRDHPARREAGKKTAGSSAGGPEAGSRPHLISGPAGDECYNLVPALAFNARQHPITARVAMPLDTDGTSLGVIAGNVVRRFTPRECERLQGFPDDYTLIRVGKHRSALASDGARYEAIGNSWPVPVARWIGARITSVDRLLEARC